jgi:hypothetical protein
MAWIVAASGTQTATVGTEHTLATVTAPGRYRLVVDVAALVGGDTPDIVELRSKTRVLSGGTDRLVHPALNAVGGLVTAGIVGCSEVVVDQGVQAIFTLKQTQGTGRGFPWKVLREFSQPVGAVVSDAGNSATSFKTDLSEATNDYWKDTLLLFTSGALVGQVRKVSGYNGSTKVITVASAFTSAPAAGDTFLLVDI